MLYGSVFLSPSSLRRRSLREPADPIESHLHWRCFVDESLFTTHSTTIRLLNFQKGVDWNVLYFSEKKIPFYSACFFPVIKCRLSASLHHTYYRFFYCNYKFDRCAFIDSLVAQALFCDVACYPRWNVNVFVFSIHFVHFNIFSLEFIFLQVWIVV